MNLVCADSLTSRRLNMRRRKGLRAAHWIISSLGNRINTAKKANTKISFDTRLRIGGHWA